jgi:hypothetical protein
MFHPSFIKLNMLVRENKHGVIPNTMWLVPNPTKPIIVVGWCNDALEYDHENVIMLHVKRHTGKIIINN